MNNMTVETLHPKHKLAKIYELLEKMDDKTRNECIHKLNRQKNKKLK